MKTPNPRIALLGLVVAASAALAACDVDKTQDGELPKVDVDVDAKAGELPKYDVTTPDVDVDTKPATVEVPTVDVDVDTEKATVPVPTVDVTTAAEKEAAER